IELSGLMAGIDGGVASQLRVFALLGLGMVESLANATLSTADAVSMFFNAQNCLYVRKKLRHNLADEVMSRGVQLHDLFEALPEQEAQEELQRELETMKSLCLQ